MIALRRDSHLTMREIAEKTGCSRETVRRDINLYLTKLDAACIEGAAALRAEEYERLDNIASKLDQAIASGDLSQVPSALKASAEIRKLYALDVQPLGRTELVLRRSVITEIATKLRDQLSPEVFAEVATCLVSDEPFQILDGVTVNTGELGDAPPIAAD